MSLTGSSDASLNLFETAAGAFDAILRDLTAAAERAVGLVGRSTFVLSIAPACLPLYERWGEATRGETFWNYTLLFEADQPIASGTSGARSAAGGSVLGEILPVPQSNVFGVASSGSSAAVDAAWYDRSIRMALELRPRERPRFDRGVLNLTASGEVAGLEAPNWAATDETRLATASIVSGMRVTVTATAIASAARLVLLAGGPDRDTIIRRWSDRSEAPFASMRTRLESEETPTALYSCPA